MGLYDFFFFFWGLYVYEGAIFEGRLYGGFSGLGGGGLKLVKWQLILDHGGVKDASRIEEVRR